MDTLDSRILDRAGKLFKRFKTRNILKTMEEVEANTNDENLPSAVVVGELINNLGGISFGYTEDGKPGFREEGADSVTPFSNSDICNIPFYSWLGCNTVVDGGDGSLWIPTFGKNINITLKPNGIYTIYGSYDDIYNNTSRYTLHSSINPGASGTVTLDIECKNYKYLHVINGYSHQGAIEWTYYN